MREMMERLLVERTGKTRAHWNKRVKAEGPGSDDDLLVWLHDQGVTGYAARLLVWERHRGYPEWMLASAGELIDAQYEGKPKLRAVFDAVVEAALDCGDITVQARKTYVSLVTARRTFARIQAKSARVDVALRLDRAPRGRLKPSRIHESMPVQVELARVADVDAVVRALIEKAYQANA